MRFLPFIFILLIYQAHGFDLKDGNCLTSGTDKIYKIKVRNENGRSLVWLDYEEKKVSSKILENQVVFFTESSKNCEFHIVSQNPSEVLFQVKFTHSDFEKKPPYENLKLRANWNFLYGDKYVSNHFYRLVECNLSGVELSSQFIKQCSKKAAEAVILKETKKETWRNDSGTRSGRGGIKVQ